MRNRQALCPACGKLLVIPPNCQGCNVRCGSCHHRFRLPAEISVTDDAIADWLMTSQEAADNDEVAIRQPVGASARVGGQAQAAPRPARTQPPAPQPVRGVEAPATPSGETQIAAPAITEQTADIRIVKLGPNGVTFEFPLRRLQDPNFRASLPQRCVRCRGRNYVQRDEFRKHPAERLSLGHQKLKGLTPGQLLARLPKVPGVAYPANLPMPYWVCDQCSPDGYIAGQMEVHTDSDLSVGRIFLRNLVFAQKFLVSVAGKDHTDHERLNRQIVTRGEDAWDAVPTLVQDRIRKWYKPRDEEQFVAYIADHRQTRSLRTAGQ